MILNWDKTDPESTDLYFVFVELGGIIPTNLPGLFSDRSGNLYCEESAGSSERVRVIRTRELGRHLLAIGAIQLPQDFFLEYFRRLQNITSFPHHDYNDEDLPCRLPATERLGFGWDFPLTSSLQTSPTLTSEPSIQ